MILPDCRHMSRASFPRQRVSSQPLRGWEDTTTMCWHMMDSGWALWFENWSAGHSQRSSSYMSSSVKGVVEDEGCYLIIKSTWNLRNNLIVFSDGLSSQVLAKCGRTTLKVCLPILISFWSPPPHRSTEIVHKTRHVVVSAVLKCSDSGEIIINNRSFEDLKWYEVIYISRWPLPKNDGKWVCPLGLP